MHDLLAARTRPAAADPTCRCLKQLGDHAARLDALFQILANPSCLVGPPVARGFQAVDRYHDMRAALRRDYEAGDRPKLPKVQLLTQYALHRALTELKPGGGLQDQMLRNTQRARRVLARALIELRDAQVAN